MLRTTNTQHSVRSTHDVVVVGARVAGAATAMLLARAGHDVLLVDRANLPRDTLSTHSLVRGGVVQLVRWGLLDEVLASGAPPIRSVVVPRARPGRRRPCGARVKDRAGVDLMLAPRRHVLDEILADAAVRAGATLLTGTTVTDVLRDDDGRSRAGVTAATGTAPLHERARIVVGADGVRSRMAGSLRSARVLEAHAAHRALLLRLRRRRPLGRLRAPRRRRRLRRRLPDPRRRGLRVAVPVRQTASAVPPRRVARRRLRRCRPLARARPTVAHRVAGGTDAVRPRRDRAAQPRPAGARSGLGPRRRRRLPPRPDQRPRHDRRLP